jgi:hypothetical protein
VAGISPIWGNESSIIIVLFERSISSEFYNYKKLVLAVVLSRIRESLWGLIGGWGEVTHVLSCYDKRRLHEGSGRVERLPSREKTLALVTGCGLSF